MIYQSYSIECLFNRALLQKRPISSLSIYSKFSWYTIPHMIIHERFHEQRDTDLKIEWVPQYRRTHIYIYIYRMSNEIQRCTVSWDGVATTSRLLKIIGLFCNRALLQRLYSAQETYDFKQPTKRSHPISYSQRISCSHYVSFYRYAVATVSRIDKITGLFCKRDL